MLPKGSDKQTGVGGVEGRLVEPEHVLQPSVSVVIPTCRRPHLVTRAVDSALNQTLKEIEVIVVVDWPDDGMTQTVLSAYWDPRLKVIVHTHQQGGSVARNTGIKAAQGYWIALLDDDDEWYPSKLEKQLRRAERSSQRYPIVSCLLIRRTPDADFVQPRRLPYPGENISDYMCSRRGLAHTDGLVQSSMVFAAREFFLRVPFDPTVQYYDDMDWLLRAFRVKGTRLEVVPEVLAIWHADGYRPRTPLTVLSWRDSYNWAADRRDCFTPRAYADFLLSSVASEASTSRETQAFWFLLRQAIRHGRPTFINFAVFFYIWCCPPELRRKIRLFLLGTKSTMKLWGGPSKAQRRPACPQQ